MAFGEFDRRLFFLFAAIAIAAITGCFLVGWNIWLIFLLPIAFLSVAAVFFSAGGIYVMAVLYTKLCTKMASFKKGGKKK